MGTVPAPLPGSVQQYCACKPDAMLWVTCPSGYSHMSLETGDNRAVTRQKDKAQPQCAAVANTAEPSPCEQRGGSSRVPECTGRFQMTLADPSASGSQPWRMCSGGHLPAVLPSQAWGKLPNSPPQESLWQGCVPREMHGGVSPANPDVQTWPGKENRGRAHLSLAGLF